MYAQVKEINHSHKLVVSKSSSIATRSDIPQIKYDFAKNTIYIKGKSTGLDLADLYDGVLETIKNHFRYSSKLNLYIYVYEFNGLSLKYFLDIFKSLKNNDSLGNESKITWFFDFENNDVMSTAFNFTELFDLNLNVIAV